MSSDAAFAIAIAIIMLGSLGMTAFMLWVRHRYERDDGHGRAGGA